MQVIRTQSVKMGKEIVVKPLLTDQEIQVNLKQVIEKSKDDQRIRYICFLIHAWAYLPLTPIPPLPF